ncbi:FAD-dependent oxidoreductase [Calycomorphotria hydatis]|uniref:FAD-dependent urate hydroxylase n=1 Tax=Calycomorphotria hydatis TaxID=2528027 RepID=A0A517T4P1_9PLAN|nr:NAD(P)/FAD-dependent oxidoreductase [Calycomorphotria hydatis]QDT63340.1 FAD-dependent urate hydroxylase [Calycomorphotria hydatis]
MRIAVAGAGIAGTTIAWQLAGQGKHVTLFEQAPQCGPVGAGILLQPSGQFVLQQLGLLDAVRSSSPAIKSLHAQHQTGGTLVQLAYQKAAPEFHALGVLRGTLFQLLFEKCVSAGVEIREGNKIARYDQSENEVTLTTEDGQSTEPFDLLIVADGSRSRLREQSGLMKSAYEYPDAALWTIGKYSGASGCLLQIVGRCGRLIGMLPVGEGQCSFFWGLKRTEEPMTRTAGVEAWKQQVADFYPPAEEAVAHVTSMDEVMYGTYRDVRMKRVTTGRVAFIGDAAHASSPHLGQGMNLALEDATCLAALLEQHDDYATAFAAYESSRRNKTAFYSALTGLLTPYFQTPNRVLQFGRDLALPIMPHLPYIGRQMALTLSGVKTGWLSARLPSDPSH